MSSLPTGYKQLQYIQSDGTQYINTGFKPGSGTRVVLDIDIFSQNGSNVAIFGARNATNQGGFCLWHISENSLRSDYGAGSVSINMKAAGRHSIDKNRHTNTIDGTQHENTAETFQCNYELYLFSINSAGSVRKEMICGKLYACQIYNEDRLIHDFVPCENPSGEKGLYDSVSATFYENAGSGNFEGDYVSGGNKSVQETKLKAIADAIREKEGSSDPIPASAFSARILALETGGLPETVRTITVGANASGRGTVTGGGLASDGTRVTVTAAANSGFRFANWTENGVSVSEDAAYTFPVAKDRTLTAVFNAKTSRLPSGYTEVEYIQSDRACGIDTGFKVNLNYDRILMDVEPTDIARLGEEDFFGMLSYRMGTSSTYAYLALWRNLSNQIYSRMSTGSTTNSGEVNGVSRMNIYADLPGKKVYLGDKSYTAFSAFISGTLTNNLYLFAPGTSATWGSVPAKLYSSQIYRSGALVKDFVPCVDASGIAGLYDLVEGQFHKNAFTGVLTAGPEV